MHEQKRKECSMSLTLCAVIPNVNDATSFYRAIGPFGNLKMLTDEKIGIAMPSPFSELMALGYRGAFFQRPNSKDHLQALEMCQDAGTPIWVDYDDFLFMVPSDNPAFKTFNKPERQKLVKKAVESANVLTVSTHKLAEYLKPLNNNVLVIPNALNDRLLVHRPKKMPKRNPLICWRGSPTHHRDVLSVQEEIISVARDPEFSSWTWNFFGDNLWFVTDFTPHEKTIWHEPIPMFMYHKVLIKVAPSVMIVPLSDNPFNRCKSNIAWLEAAYAGAITIAPDWPEWQKPGVLNYCDAKQFKEKLELVMRGGVDIEQMAGEAWEYIMDNLRLSKVNEMRKNTICALTGTDPSEIPWRPENVLRQK